MKRRLVGHRREAFVLAAATGLIGITFGFFADTSGFSLSQASALSVLTFTGASQFAVVSVVAGGGSTAAAVGSGLLLAARNSLYGPVMAPMLGRGRGCRFVAAQFLIDETTAMATAQEQPEHGREAFWFTGIWLFIFWNTGTVLGVLLGGVLDDPGTWGLDAAFPAAFVALLVPHLRTNSSGPSALATCRSRPGGHPQAGTHCCSSQKHWKAHSRGGNCHYGDGRTHECCLPA